MSLRNMGSGSLLLACATLHAYGATTVCVNPGGTQGCYASIQAAVNAVSPESTIQVWAGRILA